MNISKTFGCTFLFLSIVAFNSAATAQQSPYHSNCEDVKRILSGIHQVVEWGPFWGCRAPDVPTAMRDAAVACARVYGAGSPFAQRAHWEIVNWVDVFGLPVFLPSTYLGYCFGILPAGATGRAAVDEGKAAQAQKKIQDALDALGKK